MTMPVNQPPPALPPAPAPAPAPQQQPPAPAPAPTPAPAPQPQFAVPGGPQFPPQPQPQQPAPPLPQLILPPNVQVPPQQQAPSGQQPQQPATGADWYPEGTPVEQMTQEQQVAYWKAYARKHEERFKQRADYDALKAKADQYDQLAAATLTEHERAVQNAASQARTTALIEASSPLVDEWVKAAAYGRMDEQRVNALLGVLDRRQFIDPATGRVDAAKVTAHVHALSPSPQPMAVTVPAAQAAGVPGQPVTGQPAYPAPQPAQPVYPAVLPSAGYPVVAGQQFAAMQPYLQAPPGQQFAVPAAPPGAVPGPDFGQGHTSTARPQGIAAGQQAAQAWLARQGQGAGASTTAKPQQQ